MSVIACRVLDDRIVVASDSIVVRGWSQTKGNNLNFSKLVEVNGFILGGVGYAAELSLFRIFCMTHSPDDMSESALLRFMVEFSRWRSNNSDSGAVDNTYIFVGDGKAFVLDGFFVQEIKDYWAIGAGRDFAMTAFYFGRNAREAVEVACELSIYCELPVISFEVLK